jgi:Protein of unknown function (DUF3775)
LRAEAARAHNERAAAYLLGMPLLADHLDEALSLFDRSCDDFEMGRLRFALGPGDKAVRHDETPAVVARNEAIRTCTCSTTSFCGPFPR